jgi:prepilin-type N-terminal cleavage/methylation domain-containing protein
MMKNKNLQSGFTIIESLVAIAILVVAVIGSMSAVQSGISSYIYSKDQVVAFYLAQEAFEQVRNIRDGNVINGSNWLADIAEVADDPCYFGQACMVSPVESSIASRCSAPGQCPKLRQDPDEGFYGYNSSWPETIFKREITLESINGNEVAMTVIINWSKGIMNREFKARENILNWQAESITP